MMRVIHADSSVSRFTAIQELASALSGAPLGQSGVPCVYAAISEHEGKSALVAQSLEQDSKTVLVLQDKDPSVLKASLDYLKSRFASSGFKVVGQESALITA